MKELDYMVQELISYFNSKYSELKKHPNFNINTESLFQNRKNDIDNFKIASQNIDPDPFLKMQIINNFKNDMNKIKLRIDEIVIL